MVPGLFYIGATGINLSRSVITTVLAVVSRAGSRLRRRAGARRPGDDRAPASGGRGDPRHRRRGPGPARRPGPLHDHEPPAPRLHAAGLPGRPRGRGRSARRRLPRGRRDAGPARGDADLPRHPGRGVRRPADLGRLGPADPAGAVGLLAGRKRRARPVRRRRAGLQGRHRLHAGARGQGGVRRLGLPRAPHAAHLDPRLHQPGARARRPARRGPAPARRGRAERRPARPAGRRPAPDGPGRARPGAPRARAHRHRAPWSASPSRRPGRRSRRPG